MDINDVLSFIIQHGPYLVILVLILCIFILGLAYLGVWFREIKKNILKTKSKFFDKTIIEYIEILAKLLFTIVMLALMILLTASIYDEFRSLIWDNFSKYYAPLVSIVIGIVLIIIITQVIKRSFRFLRIRLKKRPGAILKPETTKFIELTLVYLVYTIGLIIILAIALSTIGFSEPIREGLVTFFDQNLSRVILIVIGLVILYGISQFFTAFINDVKSQSTRYSANTLDMSRNLMNYILLIIAVMLVVFSIFSFTGLSDLGKDILTTIIIVLGLIIAVSASSTFGNFFAGLVLMITSPFEHGDTVKIGNGIVGKVQSKAMFTTKVLTGDGEEIKIPNIKLIESQIINYSNNEVAPLTIDVKVNYDVTSPKVHELLLASANKTEGIDNVKHPPQVFTVTFEETSIKYRLRVYYEEVSLREEINSELLDNIQKTFNDAEISFKG